MESLCARPQLRLLHPGTKISHHLEHPALPGAIESKNLFLPFQIVFLVVRGYPRISNCDLPLRRRETVPGAAWRDRSGDDRRVFGHQLASRLASGAASKSTRPARPLPR